MENNVRAFSRNFCVVLLGRRWPMVTAAHFSPPRVDYSSVPSLHGCWRYHRAMDLADIRIDPDAPDGAAHSFTVALHTSARASGCSATHDAIVTATGRGLGARFSLLTDVPAAWIADRQDCSLPFVAEVFGLTVRSLNPPAAVDGLDAAPEFTGHFIDSYKPLIVRALAHGQPVLAWGGWGGHPGFRWGVVIQEGGGALGLLGCVPGIAGVVPLTLAATQCHVVERWSGAVPDPSAVLACGVDSILTDDGGSVCGPAAYSHWIDWSQSHPNDGDSIRDLSDVLIADYGCGVRFLESIDWAGNPNAGEIVALTEAAQRACDALKQVAGSGRDAMIGALRAARSAEEEIHAIARRFRGRLR